MVRDAEHQRRRRLRRPTVRGLVTLALVVTIPIGAVGGGFYWWMDTHALFDTIPSCARIRDRAARRDCYSKRMTDLVRHKGIDKAHPLISGYADVLPSFGEQCHMALHPIGEEKGRAAALRHRQPRAFRFLDWCTEGYTHGFIIGYLGASGSFREAQLAAGKLCRGSVQASCLHAFGHHFARIYPNAIDTGVDRCVAIRPLDFAGAKKESYTRDCLYGLFMEYSFADRARRHPHRNNCDGRWPRQVRLNCYRFLPSRVVILGDSAEDAVHVCRTVPRRGGYRRQCVNAAVDRDVITADEPRI